MKPNTKVKTSIPGQSELLSNVSRRQFLRQTVLFAAGASFLQSPASVGWLRAASASSPDLVQDTCNGLLAFVVPGPDAYSVAQGVSTTSPGGIASNVLDALIQTLDLTLPFEPSFSATIAALLNGIAQEVNPGGGGTFLSPFSNLSFAQKAEVFEVMNTIPDAQSIAGPLPGFVALLAYSEAGVYDAATGTLTATPVGWTLASYPGPSDGLDEFKGYYQMQKIR